MAVLDVDYAPNGTLARNFVVSVDPRGILSLNCFWGCTLRNFHDFWQHLKVKSLCLPAMTTQSDCGMLVISAQKRRPHDEKTSHAPLESLFHSQVWVMKFQFLAIKK